MTPDRDPIVSLGEALGLLREIEWQQACGPAGYESFDVCLFCGKEQSSGHADDCALALLLARVEA